MGRQENPTRNTLSLPGMFLSDPLTSRCWSGAYDGLYVSRETLICVDPGTLELEAPQRCQENARLQQLHIFMLQSTTWVRNYQAVSVEMSTGMTPMEKRMYSSV